MACFRMLPFYGMPRHRAINHFLAAYHDEWLDHEESLGIKLIEDITVVSEELRSNHTRAGETGENQDGIVDPTTSLTRAALEAAIDDSSDGSNRFEHLSFVC